jgi:hypothetical protein
MPDPTPPVPSSTAHCPRCGADNRCALTTGTAIENCWCSQRPAMLPLPASATADCYCARCLVVLLEAGDAR